MIAGLFFLYFLVILLALFRQRRTAIVFACIALLLSIAMFYHHITEVIPVRL